MEGQVISLISLVVFVVLFCLREYVIISTPVDADGNPIVPPPHPMQAMPHDHEDELGHHHHHHDSQDEEEFFENDSVGDSFDGYYTDSDADMLLGAEDRVAMASRSSGSHAPGSPRLPGQNGGSSLESGGGVSAASYSGSLSTGESVSGNSRSLSAGESISSDPKSLSAGESISGDPKSLATDESISSSVDAAAAPIASSSLSREVLVQDTDTDHLEYEETEPLSASRDSPDIESKTEPFKHEEAASSALSKELPVIKAETDLLDYLETEHSPVSKDLPVIQAQSDINEEQDSSRSLPLPEASSSSNWQSSSSSNDIPNRESSTRSSVEDELNVADPLVEDEPIVVAPMDIPPIVQDADIQQDDDAVQQEEGAVNLEIAVNINIGDNAVAADIQINDFGALMELFGLQGTFVSFISIVSIVLLTIFVAVAVGASLPYHTGKLLYHFIVDIYLPLFDSLVTYVTDWLDELIEPAVIFVVFLIQKTILGNLKTEGASEAVDVPQTSVAKLDSLSSPANSASKVFKFGSGIFSSNAPPMERIFGVPSHYAFVLFGYAFIGSIAFYRLVCRSTPFSYLINSFFFEWHLNIFTINRRRLELWNIHMPKLSSER